MLHPHFSDRKYTQKVDTLQKLEDHNTFSIFYVIRLLYFQINL